MHEIILPSSRFVRLRNSYRYPLQASLAARIPGVGRRVPLRPYWRRRWLGAGLPVGRPIAGLLQRRPRARTAGRTIALSAGSLGDRASRAARHIDRRASFLVLGVALGATAMFYLDPHQGRRRRALARDKLAHARNLFTKKVPRTVERRARFFQGVAQGVAHEAAELVGLAAPDQDLDDDKLVARVRSEVLRDRDLSPGEIHIDAYQGRVTLRGQLDHPDDIRRLVDETKRVESVREVRSYLHLPGTLPPNKAASYVAVPDGGGH